MKMLNEKKVLIGVLVFGIFSILFIWLGDPNYVYSITREDKEVETITAVLFFIALILAIINLIKKNRSFFSIIWVILLIFFLGEETSWFQRIFNYSVPSIENMNAQEEFNFHNLDIFQGGSLLDSDAGWATLLKSQNLFRLGFFGYFLFLPLLLSIDRLKKVIIKLGYIKPSKMFVIILLVVFGISFFLATKVEFQVKMAMAETREMLYAFFIFIYVTLYMWMMNSKVEKL